MEIYNGDQKLFNIKDIYIFHGKHDDYWHIRFLINSERSYTRSNLRVKYSCLNESESQNCLKYLTQLAEINELVNEDGDNLLRKQYDNLNFIDEDTAMANYINPAKHKLNTYRIKSLIFPFGGNASQFKAVRNAMCNQISVIQGPPGTGKTQTILNIIANLLIDGKSVQIVSNNNSATENVLEKLASSKYNMGFLVAALGKYENKDIFIKSQTGYYPDLTSWEIDTKKQIELREKIKINTEELTEAFITQEKLAKVRVELDSLILEIKYFEQYCNETGLVCSDIKPRHNLKSETLMELWQDCFKFSERDRSISFWFKIKSAFIYGISDWKFYKRSLPSIITLLQSLFYQARRSELAEDISTMEKYLLDINAIKKMDELTAKSIDYLRGILFEKYGKIHERVLFSSEDLWKRPDDVIKEYPIVLSTTFSSRSCLNGVTYDYIVMDEASQVDIATGALALSSARNTVIVGDLKQLSNVVKDEMKLRSDEIFNSYNLPKGYSFSENSFLKSVIKILPDIAQTLLREHYRCHPKIIGFCNQKFYNNELVIMTEDKRETDVLSVFKTTIGNHKRDHMNQRQIDIAIREALPKFMNAEPEDIGIIAPYKDQVKAIAMQLETDKIEVKTVHKFQGREKDTIMLTTVDDVVTDFADNLHLLNVAVSRYTVNHEY